MVSRVGQGEEAYKQLGNVPKAEWAGREAAGKAARGRGWR